MAKQRSIVRVRKSTTTTEKNIEPTLSTKPSRSRKQKSEEPVSSKAAAAVASAVAEIPVDVRSPEGKEIVKHIFDEVANEEVERRLESELSKTEKSKLDMDAQFEHIFGLLSGELESFQSNRKHVVNKRFLKSLIKELKVLKSKTGKKRRSTLRPNSVQSGIMKKRSITDEMADFAGWERGSQHSRVECSTAIVRYAKERNLQNPEYRRQYFPDRRMTEILRYDNTTEPILTFPYIQKKLSHLFMD